jgi:1-pyrroline-5-carboxylate dehydrogenase
MSTLKHAVNEPVRSYDPQTSEGSAQRASLKARLEAMARERVEIPLVIGGKAVRTGKTRKVVMPHSHGEVVAEFHLAGEAELELAAQAALKAKSEWEALSPADRCAVFLKAADLLARPTQCSNDAWPVEKCLSGRDRCGL